jgi:hypothetical protein
MRAISTTPIRNIAPESKCRGESHESTPSLVIDLSCLTFLDSDSASVLCRLKAQPGIALTGLYLFTRLMIEGQGRTSN